MDIHEYQAKELLANFGVPVPSGGIAYTPEQAVYRATEIGGARFAVKAQITPELEARQGVSNSAAVRMRSAMQQQNCSARHS